MSVAVVTGSASGMGAATSALLRERGYRVIGVDLRDAEVTADLADRDGRDAAVHAVDALVSGPLDAMVTFAGVSGFGGRTGGLVASIDYFGAVDLLRGLRHRLAAAGGAAALAISSNAATTTPGVDAVLVDACLDGDERKARHRADAIGGPATYAAAKFALARWVRRVSVTGDWIGCGISLNALAPGRVETPLVAEMEADEVGRAISERIPIPIGRGARPDEIAQLTAFLLGEHARFLVGSVVHVDGGTDACIRADDWPSMRAPRQSTQ